MESRSVSLKDVLIPFGVMVSSLRIFEEIFRTYPNFQTSPPFPPKKSTKISTNDFFLLENLLPTFPKCRAFSTRFSGKILSPKNLTSPRKSQPAPGVAVGGNNSLKRRRVQVRGPLVRYLFLYPSKDKQLE